MIKMLIAISWWCEAKVYGSGQSWEDCRMLSGAMIYYHGKAWCLFHTVWEAEDRLMERMADEYAMEMERSWRYG